MPFNRLTETDQILGDERIRAGAAEVATESSVPLAAEGQLGALANGRCDHPGVGLETGSRATTSI
jgi:hypothetical protein